MLVTMPPIAMMNWLSSANGPGISVLKVSRKDSSVPLTMHKKSAALFCCKDSINVPVFSIVA